MSHFFAAKASCELYGISMNYTGKHEQQRTFNMLNW